MKKNTRLGFVLNPLLATDGYKTGHNKMYPDGISVVCSNYTCRSTARMPLEAKEIVVFGVQYMVLYLHNLWEENFFQRDKHEVCNEAKEVLSAYLGIDYDVKHFEKLHDLGYLPILVKALDEGTVVTEKIPLFTIRNTNTDFAWITNFLETMLSTLIWKPVHSASLARAYKKILVKYAKETDEKNIGFVDFQGHDFSFRGMQSSDAAIASGMGFLTSFKGTDTIPAIQAIKAYYGTAATGFSVPATEHSVMCAHGKEGEIKTLEFLMDKYPTGILSVVSDTWDLWKLVGEYLPTLKDTIMARDGKLVIRPDSGDPVDILCGQPTHLEDFRKEDIWYDVKGNDLTIPRKGLVEILWDIFGGITNEQGFKVLDPHIGAIYGDSITLERAKDICERLKKKGFASTNVVLGIGSFSMGYATRDSQGGAVKSTYVELLQDGKTIERPIFKDPKTDDGTKKSLKGLIKVVREDGVIKAVDECTWSDENTGLLTPVYVDGDLVKDTNFEQIRERLNNQ